MPRAPLGQLNNVNVSATGPTHEKEANQPERSICFGTTD
jgi:hypothetical protein